MSKQQRIGRRRFLKQAAAAAVGSFGFPYVISSTAFGRDGGIAPSEKIAVGCIGVGWMGFENLKGFLALDDVKVLAVCDVDGGHLDIAAKKVNSTYGNEDCAKYGDFRELLARDDIDAVMLGLPDHWHAIPAIMAAKAGKDIYGEKPLSYSFAEGRAMCDAVKRYGRVWQTGSWQRSVSNFRFACELVRNGRIGKVHRVEVGLPGGHSDFDNSKGQESIVPPPANLDFEMWLGPAPYRDYCRALLPKNWRWVMGYGGGQLMDWIGHHLDIAHWGLGFDHTGPVEIEGSGEFPKTGLWDSAIRYRFMTKYANGIEMVIAGWAPDIAGGTKWIGEDGWVFVNRGVIDASSKELLNEKIGPNEINLLHSPGHYRDFIDCVKSRALTITPCEAAHRSATVGHLGQIAIQTGRKIKWDPEKEIIIGDEDASRMLSCPMRSPWRI